MRFLNLNKKLEKIDRRYRGVRKSKKNKNLVRVIIFLLATILTFYIPAYGVFQSSRQIVKNVKALSASLKGDNLNEVRVAISNTRSSTKSLNRYLSFMFWLNLLPIVNNYYWDIRHLGKALDYELQVAQELTTILDPYKAELGLDGQMIPDQDRVAQGLKVLNKIIPHLDRVEPQLKISANEVARINVEKYPVEFGRYKVREYLGVVKDFIIGAHFAVTEGRDALEVAPFVLGNETPKNYLLIFQNDKEIRATGGFMTAYAFLKLDKGHFSTTASDDIYRLDEKLLTVCLTKICPIAPPDPIVKYLPEVTGKPRTAWSMRDSNLSPDLPSSMQQFEKMYKMLGEGLQYDGIITIDTKVVEEIIKITGPIEVFGTKYSGEIDDRCNCPNVIYELEKYSQVVEKGEVDRKAILGPLMQQLLAQSIGTTSDKLPAFIDIGVKLVNQKHIMFYMHDTRTQQALSKINWTGEINKDFDGDYLHINDSNFAGGKTNLYIQEKVSLNISIDSTSEIKHKLTIEYKNPQPFNRWLNTIYRDYIRVYVPKDSKLINSEGSDNLVTSNEDKALNKTFFESFITVRPQNSRTLSFEYSVPSNIKNNSYILLIQKQPGSKDHKYNVKVNGKAKGEFELSSDKKIEVGM